MGACLSCLGLKQDPADHEPSETERLLYDETTTDRAGYGTAHPGSHVSAPDPEEERRHREMLQDICAETASNLIDVQHTSLLTSLRGDQPSSEFAHLLNTHFPRAPEGESDQPSATTRSAAEEEDESEGDDAAGQSGEAADEQRHPRTPQTPNPSSHHHDIREPPSPFTQAQIAAAAAASQSRNPGATAAGTTRGATTPRKGPDAGGHGADVTEEDEEEAWLASVTGGKEVRWDEIKGPDGPLVVRLEGDKLT